MQEFTASILQRRKSCYEASFVMSDCKTLNGRIKVTDSPERMCKMAVLVHRSYSPAVCV
jgi:hypothetical protein